MASYTESIHNVSVLYLKLHQMENEMEDTFEKRVHKYRRAVDKHNHSILTNPYYDSGFDVFQPGNMVEERYTMNGKEPIQIPFILKPERTYKIPLGVSGAMYKFNAVNKNALQEDTNRYLFSLIEHHQTSRFMTSILSGHIKPEPYFLFPRSSIYKKAFRLANSAGIIDTGYRGLLGAVIDCHKTHLAEKYETYDSCDIQKNSVDLLERIEATNSVVPLERYFQICKPNLGKFMVVLVDELPSTERGEGGFGSTGK